MVAEPKIAYKGNENLKNSGVSIDWTPDLLLEYKKCMNDPIYFCRKYMKIVNLDRGLVNFDLYDYQEDLINTFIDENRVIVLSSRQSGKCFGRTQMLNIRNKKTGQKISISGEALYELIKSGKKM